MEEKRVSNNLMNAYIDLRNRCDVFTFERFNVIVIMQPKILRELMSELPYGIQRNIDLNCYFIELCGHKTPLLINAELPKEIEFQIMTQKDYERMEKEKLYIKLDKMFYESQV